MVKITIFMDGSQIYILIFVCIFLINPENRKEIPYRKKEGIFFFIDKNSICLL